MTPIEPGSGKDVGGYWSELTTLLPIVIIGGLAAMISFLRKAYSHTPAKCKWRQLALSTLIGGVAALAAIGPLPLLFGPDISPKIEIAFAALAGAYGQKTFDIIVHKILGEKPGDNDDNQN